MTRGAELIEAERRRAASSCPDPSGRPSWEAESVPARWAFLARAPAVSWLREVAARGRRKARPASDPGRVLPSRRRLRPRARAAARWARRLRPPPDWAAFPGQLPDF